MAKYIKQEMPDMTGTGEKKAYYRMKTYRNIGMEEFIQKMTYHGGISRGTAISVLTQAMETLSELVGSGYSVSIEGLGTFKATIGLRRDKEMDSLDGDDPKHNSKSLCLNGVNFRADKELIKRAERHCELERSHVSRLHKSPYTREERLALALQFIDEHGFMRINDYASLTGLSRTSACTELQELRRDPNSGITAQGRRPVTVYVRRKFES